MIINLKLRSLERIFLQMEDMLKLNFLKTGMKMLQEDFTFNSIYADYEGNLYDPLTEKKI